MACQVQLPFVLERERSVLIETQDCGDRLKGLFPIFLLEEA